MSQQFCLKWNNHMNNMMDVFKNLLSTEAMVDVTLACDGLSLKAHKIVLSACSPFFQSLFLENPCKHPIVILKDMKYTELKAIIEFMYHGEVNVAQDQLSALMKTAETLRVKGLAEVTNEKNQSSSQDDSSSHRSVPRTDTPPPSKRRRGRTRKRSISDQSDDEASEPKIKQPDSPEIEELSGDMDTNTQYSNTSTVPLQSHSTNSFHNKSSQQEQPVDQGADESFAPEEKFNVVEPSKLLEQTLTTDDLPRRGGRSSVQSNMELQRRSRSTDHSTALVPVSMPSDALVVANQQPESPPDIKPELLDLEPPMSPVAGPSHSTDENSMMMYMDQSSMSGMPGPSGYQDNSALVSTDSQPQDNVKVQSFTFPDSTMKVHLSCKELPKKNIPSNSTASKMLLEGHFDLIGILNSSPEGQRVLSRHSRLSTFTDDDRSKIANIMECYIKKFCQKITREELLFLVGKIVETFPSEKEDHWIFNEVLSDGELVSGIRFFKEENFEIVSGICKAHKNTAMEEESWSALLLRWKETAKQRIQEIQKSNNKLQEYFKKYSLLSQANGFILLEKDFEFLYPNAVENLTAEWPKVSLFVENILKEKIPSFFGEDTTPEFRMMKLLMNIAKIFPTTTSMKGLAASYSNVCSRFKAQQSFLLVIDSVNDLQSAYEKHVSNVSQSSEKKMLPLPVVLGNIRQIKKSLVILDTAIYEVDNPLKAIDLAFKIFRALNLHYPPGSEQIWTFLQQAVYKIFTDTDKNHITTSELVARYQNFNFQPV